MTDLFMEQEPLYKQGWNDERTLLLKLSAILGEVGAIPKTGFNKFHSYAYHSEADINSAFQKLFHAHKIMFSASMVSSEMRETTTNKGNTEYIYKANMRFTFFDAESGESLTGCMSGEGQDNGDKALYKSISGTQKYILMKTFMITDHNDPEGDPTVDERNHGKKPQQQQTSTSNANSPQTPPQQQTGQSQGQGAMHASGRVFAITKELGWKTTEINQFATDALGFEVKYPMKDYVKTTAQWEAIEQALLATKQALQAS